MQCNRSDFQFSTTKWVLALFGQHMLKWVFVLDDRSASFLNLWHTCAGTENAMQSNTFQLYLNGLLGSFRAKLAPNHGAG